MAVKVYYGSRTTGTPLENVTATPNATTGAYGIIARGTGVGTLLIEPGDGPDLPYREAREDQQQAKLLQLGLELPRWRLLSCERLRVSRLI